MKTTKAGLEKQRRAIESDYRDLMESFEIQRTNFIEREDAIDTAKHKLWESEALVGCHVKRMAEYQQEVDRYRRDQKLVNDTLYALRIQSKKDIDRLTVQRDALAATVLSFVGHCTRDSDSE